MFDNVRFGEYNHREETPSQPEIGIFVFKTFTDRFAKILKTGHIKRRQLALTYVYYSSGYCKIGIVNIIKHRLHVCRDVARCYLYSWRLMMQPATYNQH